MKPCTTLLRAHRSLAAILLLVPLAFTACAPPTPPSSPTPAAAVSHIHGISVDPVSTRILLPTHDGLFDATTKTPVKVSEATIDLMGFTATGEPNVFYASGHPGPGSSLPNPVGLIRSTDAGKTWQPVPGGPVIQFVTFATPVEKAPTEAVGVAPDGSVYVSTDTGLTWKATGRIAGQVEAVTAREGSPGKPWIWAATTEGVQVSTDGGATFHLAAS